MTPSEQSNTEDPRLNQCTTGAVWRHRREKWRQVTITGLYTDGTVRYVDVRRNTSRRTQGISERTLLREYEYSHRSRS